MSSRVWLHMPLHPHPNMEHLSTLLRPESPLVNGGLSPFINRGALPVCRRHSLIVQRLALCAPWSTTCIRASIGARQRCILPQLCHHMPPHWSAHWPGIVMTPLTGKNNLHALEGIPHLLPNLLIGAWRTCREGLRSTSRRWRCWLPVGRPRAPLDVFVGCASAAASQAFSTWSVTTGSDGRRVIRSRDTRSKPSPGPAWPARDEKNRSQPSVVLPDVVTTT